MTGLNALLSRIFPPGCSIVAASSVPESQRFVVISGKDGIRWIAPLSWPYAETVLRQWSPINPVSRAKWRAVLIAHRLRCVDRIPGTTVIGIANLDSAHWHRLGLAYSANVIPIVYIARPSTTQKAVVSLYSLDSGKVECVVKVALGDSAWPSIERDYSNLQSVERLSPGLAPRPIGLASEWMMSSQEWIAGKTSLRPSEPMIHDYLDRLWLNEPTSLSELAQRYHRKFAALPRRETGDQIEKLFESIRCDDRVPAAFYHGDFVSWNLIRQDDGPCRAIDWEFGNSDGAPLLDLFHYLLRFPLAAGTIDSYQTAVNLTLGVHGAMVNSVLDRLGASYRYAENALLLCFIALYVTRFNQICSVERIQPQLSAIAKTFNAHRFISAER